MDAASVMAEADAVCDGDEEDTAGDADPLEGDADPGEQDKCRIGDEEDGRLPGGDGPCVGVGDGPVDGGLPGKDGPGVDGGDAGADETARWADAPVSRSGSWAGVVTRGAAAAVTGAGGLVAWDMHEASRST